MLGFSREVASEVTQPLWPSRVPLRMSCSVMLMEVLGVAESIEDVGSGRYRNRTFCQCGIFLGSRLFRSSAETLCFMELQFGL
jgi:hypothetical protein